MRFTLIKNLKQDNSMRPILNALLSFTLMYLVLDIFVTQESIGLFSEKIKITLFGNEEEFVDPMSSIYFLEYIHTQIFFLMMIFLTLSAVYARVSTKKTYSIIVINTLMVSGLLALISLFLSFFSNELFINVYVGSFFIWHITAIYMTLYSLWSLNYAKSL